MSRPFSTAHAALLCTLLLAAPTAAAEPVRNADDRWQIELSDGWPGLDKSNVSRNESTGQQLVVRRIDGPSPDAWRGKREFFDSVEDGARATAKDYKRAKRTIAKAGRVPTMDLWFSYRADDGARVAVAMRFLFFRRYALVLAVDTPADKMRAHRRGTRKLLRSFVPYFSDSD